MCQCVHVKVSLQITTATATIPRISEIQRLARYIIHFTGAVKRI